jgi:hypothetical protein
MANIYNANNYNNFKDTSLFFNNSLKIVNSLDNFKIINYRGLLLPRINLDSSNSQKLAHLIYYPIEDIYSNKKEDNICIEINQKENESLINHSNDVSQINYVKDLNSKLFVNEEKIFMEKNSNFIKDKDDLIKNMKSDNIEPIPPNNIISIINNDKNNNKYRLSSHCINIAEINNIIINNINQISNYSGHTIINQINNQTIYNLNFNIYTNNVFLNNKKLIRKHSKPIFAVCSESDEIQTNKSKRGRKSMNLKKNYRIHAASDDDNLLRKLQVHFLSFIINYVNDVIKTFIDSKKPPLFQKLDYQIKKNVNHKIVESFKKKRICEILQLRISPKIKIHEKNVNKIVYQKICILCPFMIHFLNTNFLSLFKEYYNNDNRLFIVNGRIIQLSEHTKTFYDLMINNINHKDKLKNIANRFFINNNNN